MKVMMLLDSFTFKLFLGRACSFAFTIVNKNGANHRINRFPFLDTFETQDG